MDNVTDPDAIATAIADRCSEFRKDGKPKAPHRYAVIWQAARMGARAALATALAEREGERAEIARLREALAWYANENNWRTSTVYMCGHSGTSNVTADGGKRARATHSGETQ